MSTKIIHDTIDSARGQFNSIKRAVDVHGFYTEIVLWKERDEWDGQRTGTVEVFIRPSTPTRVMFTYPPGHPHVSTYGQDEQARHDDLIRACDHVTEQIADWVATYVVPVPPELR